jgi:hypothetical protein
MKRAERPKLPPAALELNPIAFDNSDDVGAILFHRASILYSVTGGKISLTRTPRARAIFTFDSAEGCR